MYVHRASALPDITLPDLLVPSSLDLLLIIPHLLAAVSHLVARLLHASSLRLSLPVRPQNTALIPSLFTRVFCFQSDPVLVFVLERFLGSLSLQAFIFRSVLL